MTTNDTFGRDLSRWLHEEGEHRVPDHLTEVLVRTAATRQRPWWSSPERWLPMDTTLRPVQTPRLVWVFVVLALVLALGAVLVVTAGSRAPRPAPLVGLAGAGPVVYSTIDGDILALDPASGTSTSLIGGDSVDIFPWFTNDGTRFSFLRKVAEPDTWNLMQASADGSDVRPMLQGDLTNVDWFEWSTDGRRAVVMAMVDGVPQTLVIDATAETPPIAIDPGLSGTGEFTWRSDADEIIFRGIDGASRSGIHAIRPDGSGLRTIVDGTPSEVIGSALSPDGSRVAYTTVVGDHGELRIVDADTGMISAPVLDGTVNDFQPRWSPDGTRLAFIRHSLGSECQVGVAGTTGGHATLLGPTAPSAGGCADVTWSPDGRSLIAYYPFNQTTWRLDPNGGLGTKLGISGKDLALSWRRLGN